MIEAPSSSSSADAHAAAAEAAEATSNNNNSNDLHFPPPVFEGSEKRLEIDFYAPDPASAPARGLRAIPRADLDALLADVSFLFFFLFSFFSFFFPRRSLSLSFLLLLLPSSHLFSSSSSLLHLSLPPSLPQPSIHRPRAASSP